jgi:hypothetical protein
MKKTETANAVITGSYPATKNQDTGAWRPARITVFTEAKEGYIRTGEHTLKIWALRDFDTNVVIEPVKMPDFYTALGDIEQLIGKRIQFSAIAGTDREGNFEWAKIKDIRMIGDQSGVSSEASSADTNLAEHQSSPKITPKPQPVQANVSGIDADSYVPMNRQEVGMSIGNARTNGAMLVAAYVRATNGKIPTRQWLTDVAKATLHYQESLLGQRGSEEPETAPEDDDFEQLGVLE